jgi:hypothetical protein
MSAAAAAAWQRIAQRRVLAPLPWLVCAAAAALVVARALAIQSRTPLHAAANQALCAWLGLGVLIAAAGASAACARAGARATRELAWLARWPQRPALARVALCALCGLAGGAASGCVFAAGALALAPATRWDATHTRALVGPELWLERGAAPERWQLADPRGVLSGDARLCFEVSAHGGPGARARLSATRVDPTSGARGATTQVESWVAGSAQLVLTPPSGAGDLELALAHVDGRAALRLSTARACVCTSGASTWRACGWLAARAALACAALAALGYGLAHWMRAPLAAATACTALGALALLSPALGADWRACADWTARGIAPSAPPLEQFTLLAACAAVGALASAHGGRAP